MTTGNLLETVGDLESRDSETVERLEQVNMMCGENKIYWTSVQRRPKKGNEKH